MTGCWLPTSIPIWVNPADQCVKFDFEHGISDWVKTGTAFENQPTYGDNPTAREKGQPANQKGDWWIGGYENRPRPSSPAGEIQGDGPKGTLTSPTFRIIGGKLSFLIGGGCDADTVYAELLIDQVPVFKATGSCSETMEERDWDVSAHHGKEAQLRLVDNTSGGWGHINFDHMIDEHCQQSDPIPPWCIARSMHRRPFSTLSKFRFGWWVWFIAVCLENSFDGWWLYHTEANRLGFWKVPVLLPLSAGETECAGFVVFRYSLSPIGAYQWLQLNVNSNYELTKCGQYVSFDLTSCSVSADGYLVILFALILFTFHQGTTNLPYFRVLNWPHFISDRRLKNDVIKKKSEGMCQALCCRCLSVNFNQTQDPGVRAK